MSDTFFLTVDWCNKGHRGIFCHTDGRCFRKDGEPHSYDEIWGILDVFYIILSPQSLSFTEDEIAEFTQFMPLAEYSKQYGIALRQKEEK